MSYDSVQTQFTLCDGLQGCHKAFQEWLETNVTIALTVLIAVIVLQVNSIRQPSLVTDRSVLFLLQTNFMYANGPTASLLFLLVLLFQ